jgi:hypothetical protein
VGGGPAVEVPHSVGAVVGPGPDRQAARRCSTRDAPGADGQASVVVRAGMERSGARARVGRPEKKTGSPSPDEQYGFGFI